MDALQDRDIPLAYHEMCLSRADRRLRWVCIGWAVSLILTVATFAFMWLQYDYVGTETVEYSGVYNLVDSEGNVISSDLTAEEVIKALEVLNRGNIQANKDTDAG